MVGLLEAFDEGIPVGADVIVGVMEGIPETVGNELGTSDTVGNNVVDRTVGS